MQSYKYDKAIPPESKNGGSPALNNNPAKSSSKKALLICLDCLCLVMGEHRGLRAPSPRSRTPHRSPGKKNFWESFGGGRAELGRAPAAPLPKQKRSGAAGRAGPGSERGSRGAAGPGRGARGAAGGPRGESRARQPRAPPHS